jgi:hypothetical protein
MHTSAACLLSTLHLCLLLLLLLLQNLLNQLLTVDLPAMMVLPERLEISVPPSVTSIAEAAVGRDTIMRAVASAVLQVRLDCSIGLPACLCSMVLLGYPH